MVRSITVYLDDNQQELRESFRCGFIVAENESGEETFYNDLIDSSEYHSIGDLINDIVGIFWGEFRKNGNYHRSITNDCNKSYAPVYRVLAHQGDLIPFLNTTFLEKDVDFFYFSCYLAIGKAFTLVISQSRKVPVFLYAGFEITREFLSNR